MLADLLGSRLRQRLDARGAGPSGRVRGQAGPRAGAGACSQISEAVVGLLRAKHCDS